MAFYFNVKKHIWRKTYEAKFRENWEFISFSENLELLSQLRRNLRV